MLDQLDISWREVETVLNICICGIGLSTLVRILIGSGNNGSKGVRKGIAWVWSVLYFPSYLFIEQILMDCLLCVWGLNWWE